MIHIELDFSLHRRHMLSMNLISESPKSTLPNHAHLRVLQPQVILIVHTLRVNSEVGVGYVEPEEHCDTTGHNREDLEPAFRIQ